MTDTMQDSIDPAVRREIETRLDAVEATHGVRVLLAVESGSRAWGFPSPDSDYDVRFFYVHSRDWYLSLKPGRDVIEQPIVDEIDLNGWDVRKALGLLLKSNAIVSEWMESPIRYRPDDPFVGRLKALADALLDPRALAQHYARLGMAAAERWLDGEGEVRVKKYFYALRPAIAIRALRIDPTRRPPMNMQALIGRADLPTGIVTQIEQLVEAKRTANERSKGTRLPEIDALIRDELGRAADLPKPAPDAALRQWADELFLDLVNMDSVKFHCPCCGHRTLRERSAWEICQVCFWEDDGQGDADANEVWGGPNGELSLTMARANFRAFGACTQSMIQHVRAPLPDEQPREQK